MMPPCGRLSSGSGATSKRSLISVASATASLTAFVPTSEAASASGAWSPTDGPPPVPAPVVSRTPALSASERSWSESTPSLAEPTVAGLPVPAGIVRSSSSCM